MTLLRNSNGIILLPNRNLGNGLKFTGANSQWVDINDDVSMRMSITDGITISVWFYLSSKPSSSIAGGMTLFSKADATGTSRQGWAVALTSSTVQFSLLDDFTTGGATNDGCRYTWSPEVGRLYNFIWTKQAGIYGSATPYKIYLNGISVAYTYTPGGGHTALTASSVTTSSSNTYIGKPISTNDTFFDGVLVDAKVFKYELSATQVLQLYKSKGVVNTTLTAPVFDIRLDEKNGKSAVEKISGLNGTLNGFTDAETANSGQPQSGNTAWVNAYSLVPITV